MIERVIENWLTNVNERSMEIPFCQLLTSEGYEVVHMSRHGPFEQGKDIIAIAPDGTPCAFQLKSASSNGKISQKLWGNEYSAQAARLVEIPIRHPSIDLTKPRRVFFVTNGELDEELRSQIADQNLESTRRGYPELETITKGQLLSRFIKLNTNFWPSNLKFELDLLQLFLADGTDCLPKDRFSAFIEKVLQSPSENTGALTLGRILASGAILTTYALSPYTSSQNHVAIFEGWIIYITSAVGLIEKENLKEQYWGETLEIASFAAEQALVNLCLELKGRSHLTEGNPLVDEPFYSGRLTWLVGLVTSLSLFYKMRNQEPPNELDDWQEEFVRKHQNKMLLWGEGAVPNFLALFWFLQSITATLEPLQLLITLIRNILTINGQDRNRNSGLADPYISLQEVIEQQHGLRNSVTQYVYSGRSYFLHSLIDILVIRGWRQSLSSLWYDITRLTFVEFRPISPLHFCLWHSEEGKLVQTIPGTPQSWKELQTKSRSINIDNIPKFFQAKPEILLFLIQVYPHRCTNDVVKVLDSVIAKARGMML